MATILFAWELGAGLGHVTQLAPLANALVRRGHRVYAALRDLKAAAAGLFDPGVGLLAAPHLAHGLGPPAPTRSFVDILADLTFGDDLVFTAHAGAWRNLFELTRPDLAVFDHSPTALLASRWTDVTRVVLGNGFIVPPGVSPLPPLRPLTPDGLRALIASERRILDRVNRLLARSGRPPLDSLGQLYADADLTLLTTFPELDPYAAARPAGTRYLGPVNAVGGDPPDWPGVAGKRLYAYLSPSPGLVPVLDYLTGRPGPTLAFVPRVDARLRRRFMSPTLRLCERPLDLARVGRECDAALLNGNLGTTAAMLLAGRPSLHLPLFFEHALTARAVERLGAGLVADPGRPDTIPAHVATLLDSDECARGARSFAARHRGFDPALQGEEMLHRLLWACLHNRGVVAESAPI